MAPSLLLPGLWQGSAFDMDDEELRELLAGALGAADRPPSAESLWAAEADESAQSATPGRPALGPASGVCQGYGQAHLGGYTINMLINLPT